MKSEPGSWVGCPRLDDAPFGRTAAVRLLLVLLLLLLAACSGSDSWTPIAAHIAIEDLASGDGVAHVGARPRTDQPADLRVHAVLEASNAAGERRWFTEAASLAVDGDVVPAE